MANVDKSFTLPTPETPVAKPGVDTSNWEWVEIPEKDITGYSFEGVGINFDKYPPGKHFVSPDVAGEIRRILDGWAEQNLRLLQNKIDLKALAQLKRFGRIQEELK